MKRDIDLARALLFDIESEGADCPINRLRGTVTTETAAVETSERVRYHLRLLIDAGLVKEVDRTSSGVPCVRLTNAGHELIEVARSDVRWREAKQYTRDSTGGLSLTVLRAVLTKWAVEGVTTAGRTYPRSYRRGYRPYYHRVDPRRRYEGYRFDYREPLTEEDDLAIVRTRPDYLERSEKIDVWNRYERDYVTPVDRYDYPVETEEQNVGVSFPIYLV